MQAFFLFRQSTDLVSIRERLVARYGNIRATDTPIADIEATLEQVTFSEKNIPELKLALQTIHACFDQINLDFLKHYNVKQALNCVGK